MAAISEEEEFEFRLRAERESAQQTQPEPSSISQDAGNVLAGAVEGAGQIGATLLSPIDWAARKLGAEDSALFPTDRRQAIVEGLRTMGAQPESALYQAGKIGTEVAGTAGVGGALAKGATFAPQLASALRAGGFSKYAGLAANIAGGAATGAASAGLTGGDVGTGALIGGVLPGGISAVKTAVPAVLGMTTGAGSEAIKQAYGAGKRGGEAAKTFTENLRGNVAPEEVLNVARANIAEMGAQKANAYRQGMAQVSGDKTVLSFDGIDNAMKNAYDMATFKGVVKNVQAAKKLQETYDAIAKWKQLDPAQYHTPEGLDALKQNIGGILESIPFEEKTARNAVGNIYNSIKSEINKQAPVYSKVMKDYSSATETITEIEKALSLGKKASADTSMRKLQSLMRNNVNTNYGNRLDIARQLEQQGGQEIIPAVAGQALSSLTPRGLQSASTLPASYLGYSAGGLPLAGAGLLAGSPRLVGEAAYGTGRLANLAGRVPLSQEGLEAARLASIIYGAQ